MLKLLEILLYLAVLSGHCLLVFAPPSEWPDKSHNGVDIVFKREMRLLITPLDYNEWGEEAFALIKQNEPGYADFEPRLVARNAALGIFLTPTHSVELQPPNKTTDTLIAILQAVRELSKDEGVGNIRQIDPHGLGADPYHTEWAVHSTLLNDEKRQWLRFTVGHMGWGAGRLALLMHWGIPWLVGGVEPPITENGQLRVHFDLARDYGYNDSMLVVYRGAGFREGRSYQGSNLELYEAGGFFSSVDFIKDVAVGDSKNKGKAREEPPLPRALPLAFEYRLVLQALGGVAALEAVATAAQKAADAAQSAANVAQNSGTASAAAVTAETAAKTAASAWNVVADGRKAHSMLVEAFPQKVDWNKGLLFGVFKAPQEEGSRRGVVAGIHVESHLVKLDKGAGDSAATTTTAEAEEEHVAVVRYATEPNRLYPHDSIMGHIIDAYMREWVEKYHGQLLTKKQGEGVKLKRLFVAVPISDPRTLKELREVEGQNYYVAGGFSAKRSEPEPSAKACDEDTLLGEALQLATNDGASFLTKYGWDSAVAVKKINPSEMKARMFDVKGAGRKDTSNKIFKCPDWLRQIRGERIVDDLAPYYLLALEFPQQNKGMSTSN